ncbi:alpha-tubulin N-acetyltransferase 1-like isoform X1 [Mizuhopecten yessoensis]|uniref:Alpha-tubulin N-acetyltransferase n=1 Tax=Mizuhopecten yessoensis TaxID=6573 RepID=A0A210PSL3_MIZYE|nr:alpha-tubulin N-acetyltransferase 1-like isoform X1 [Mizuhopecten yessoensis]OWF39483.1 Alpha-tubulin N-acetyltransferase [Mizuhopecten yessoensis]
MEFPFNTNNLLGSEISKLDKKVVPFRKNADGFTFVDLRSQLCTVIDKMGDASSRAQGLHGTITGGRKLQLSDHILYIMKDSNSNNNGSGAVVGILKIGHKKLFVYDRNGGVHELEPICVLDFYVHESRQRMGCGRKLFDFMLRDMNVKPQHLAIDKPSFKFSQFLNKHYNLKGEIPQVNNFVVFEGFLNNRPNTGNGRRRLGGRPPIHPDSNFGDGEIIVQQGRSSSHYGRFQRHHSRPNSGQLSSRSAPPNRLEEPNLRELEMPVPVGVKALEIDPLINTSDQSVHLNLQPLNSTYNSRAYGAGAILYSRHVNTPPDGGRRSRPNSGSYNNREGSRANSRTSGGSRTNSRNRDQLRGPSPPMLKRMDPPSSFKEQLNLHQDYQGRDGHLKVHISPDNLSSNSPAIPNHMTPSLLPNLANNSYKSGYADRYKPLHNMNWNPGAASPTHHTIGARHYSHTRLW